MTKPRRAVKVTCAFCGYVYWTSSPVRPYVCRSCKSANSSIADSGSTSLTIAQRQDITWGRCKGHHSTYDQELANGLCSCCRFYSITDVDPDLSTRAKRSQGGEFDWVRGQR